MSPRFCPKCKSTDVSRNMTALSGALGTLADWICNDCGFTCEEFPQKEIKIKGEKRK